VILCPRTRCGVPCPGEAALVAHLVIAHHAMLTGAIRETAAELKRQPVRLRIVSQR